jgi:hypothetical protein
MGGHPYWYIVPYESDIDAALEKLKQREFEAGRYHPVIPFLEFPIAPHSPSPGRQHATIEEAIEAAEADGTRSILDAMRGVLPNPYKVDFDPANPDDLPIAGVSPLSEADRIAFFGDACPSRDAVEGFGPLWEHLQRGTAVYAVLCKNGEPHEIYFAGMSFD